MHRRFHLSSIAGLLLLLACSLLLSACQDDSSVQLGNAATAMDGADDNGNIDSPGDNGDDGSGDGGDTPQTMPPTVPVAESRDGKVYDQQVQMQTNADVVDTVVFTVMEPTELVAGQSYPLVLHGHGYGGSRNTAPDGFQQRLRDAGYYVISIDQRGFGDSSGQVRVMSPDYEGQDLIGILDWAEDLEGLRRRANGKMMVGSYGGSYGGMYQWLLAGADPEQRLRVIAPDIAPYDLTFSLNPNNVIKSGWALALVGGGEAGVLTGLGSGNPADALQTNLQRVQNAEALRQDPIIYESVLRGGLTNNFPDAAYNLFRYHSLRYFCENEPAGPQDGFQIGIPDPRDVPPGGLPKIDALLTQGFRDTLFNFNEAANSYDCLKSHGGDVRLLTHQSGHILPVSLGTAGLEDPLDPFYTALTVSAFQDAGGSRTCGGLVLDDVQFAWFEEKLRGQSDAIANALPIGKEICLSLAEGDAITVDAIPRGGESFDIDKDTPALSGPLGVLGATLGSGLRDPLLQTQMLYTAPSNGAIIAGIPHINITIDRLVDIPGVSLDCTLDILPLGCDPVYFFALGKRPPGQQRWDLIDDQLTPMRGFGEHNLDMIGIAERLSAGDEVALLIYGFHPQYPITFSRDLLVPASNVNGTVELPILAPTDIERDGV